MSNVSPNNQEFALLSQIPSGALPLGESKYLQSRQQSIPAYTTKKFQFNFYFPGVGVFPHFPSNISEADDKVKARAAFNELKAVKKRTFLKKESFRDILMGGNQAEILQFMETANLVNQERQFSWDQIQFLLKDQAFYSKLIAILRRRKIYNESVWNWAF